MFTIAHLIDISPLIPMVRLYIKRYNIILDITPLKKILIVALSYILLADFILTKINYRLIAKYSLIDVISYIKQDNNHG